MLSPGQNKAYADQRGHIIKAALYASQTFYAFMLMYVFSAFHLSSPAWSDCLGFYS